MRRLRPISTSSLVVIMTLFRQVGLAAPATTGNQPRSVDPLIQEIEDAAKKSPPKEFVGEDPGLRNLDRIMEKWSLTEKELLGLQVATLKKGGTLHSWSYLLAEGRLNRLWESQGFHTGGISAAEHKYLTILDDASIPIQMRLQNAGRISAVLLTLSNSKQPVPVALRKKFVIAMAKVAQSAVDQPFVERALEDCLLFGIDVPEAADAVLKAIEDPLRNKWYFARIGLGVGKNGLLKGGKRKQLMVPLIVRLKGGDDSNDIDSLEMAIFSAHKIARHSRNKTERGELMTLLIKLVNESKHWGIRHSAHLVLRGDYFGIELNRTATPEEKSRIAEELKNYDPEPDRRRFQETPKATPR